MDKVQLLERYEARGDERDFFAATRLYEQALNKASSAQVLLEYGYLHECHGRLALRQAVEHYRRAIERDPGADKPHYQLIHVLATLGDVAEAIGQYRERVHSAPHDVRGYRFLASAYLAAGRAEEARANVDAGLARAGDDRMLIVLRGEAKAAAGDPEGALADWQEALALGSGDISPLYSSAFVLEREGRLPEALGTWQAIVDWCEEHGAEYAAEYPRRELERVRGELHQASGVQ